MTTTTTATAATQPRLITRPAAARRMGGTAIVVQRLIDSGELAPAYRIGGRVMVPEAAVDAYIEQALIAPVAPGTGAMPPP